MSTQPRATLSDQLDIGLCGSYAALPDAFHRPARLEPLNQGRIFAFNRSLASDLGLDPHASEAALLASFNSQQLAPDARSIHMAYGGHQFGVWVPQLGDGRGLLMGEVESPGGELIDLHLKGAGLGPFSRHADGRAVLRSTIREYLCSEAMHHLGIPTTRALCLIDSDEPVQRERPETRALLVRTARSHVRFGTFEYFHHQGDTDSVQTLVNYVVERHFPQAKDNPDPAEFLMSQAVLATARMVAAWQVAGFCHGVMNTDNMSILGETFDYGPFGFMDAFNPGHICNSTDTQGRYAYNRQPSIGLWNCHALAAALTSLVSEERLREVLAEYEGEFLRHFTAGMGERLGLKDATVEDLTLIQQWLTMIAGANCDFQQAFHRLCALLQGGRVEDLGEELGDRHAFTNWHSRWMERAGEAGPDVQLMRERNPAVVLRNFYAQQAIAAAQQRDAGPFNSLLAALQDPFKVPEDSAWRELPPAEYCGTALSCSS